MDRFDAGIYACEASNGVGQAAQANLNLQVNIETEMKIQLIPDPLVHYLFLYFYKWLNF